MVFELLGLTLVRPQSHTLRYRKIINTTLKALLLLSTYGELLQLILGNPLYGALWAIGYYVLTFHLWDLVALACNLTQRALVLDFEYYVDHPFIFGIQIIQAVMLTNLLILEIADGYFEWIGAEDLATYNIWKMKIYFVIAFEGILSLIHQCSKHFWRN